MQNNKKSKKQFLESMQKLARRDTRVLSVPEVEKLIEKSSLGNLKFLEIKKSLPSLVDRYFIENVDIFRVENKETIEKTMNNYKYYYNNIREKETQYYKMKHSMLSFLKSNKIEELDNKIQTLKKSSYRGFEELQEKIYPIEKRIVDDVCNDKKINESINEFSLNYGKLFLENMRSDDKRIANVYDPYFISQILLDYDSRLINFSKKFLERLKKKIYFRLSFSEFEDFLRFGDPSRWYRFALEKEIPNARKRDQLKNLKAASAINTEEQRVLARSERNIKRYHRQLQIFTGCPYCSKAHFGDQLSPDVHLDHIYPVSRGGRSLAQNLVFICSECNSTKSDKTLAIFCNERGFDLNEVTGRLIKLGKSV